MTSFNLFLGKPSAKADAFIKMPTRYKYVNDTDWRTTLIGGGEIDQIVNPRNIKEIIIGTGTQENPVTSIGVSTFENCSKLMSVIIPNNVTNIGTKAFENCTNLTSMTIPDSVTSIGASAFFNCNGLTNVTIGNGVTIINGYAFYGCSNLTKLLIPDSVTSIGNKAFRGCTNLMSVAIPDSVTSIGPEAFFDCSSLVKVTIIANGGNAENVKQMMINAGATNVTTWNMPTVWGPAIQ